MATSPKNSSSIETSRKCKRASPTESFQKKRKSMSVQETMDARRKSSQLHGQSITELGSSCRPTPQDHQNFIQCDGCNKTDECTHVQKNKGGGLVGESSDISHPDVGEDVVDVCKKLIEEDLAGEDEDENVSDSSDEDEHDHDKRIEAEEAEEEEEEDEEEDEEALEKIFCKRWKKFKKRAERGGVGAGRKRTNDVQKNKGGGLVGESSDISPPDVGEDVVDVCKKLIEEDLAGEDEDENVSDSSDEDEHDHDKCIEAEEAEEEEEEEEEEEDEEALEKILFKGLDKYFKKRAERGGVGAGRKRTNECTDVQKNNRGGLVGGSSDISHPDVGEDENVSYSSDEDYHDHSKCIEERDEALSRRWDIFYKRMEKLGGVGAATTVPTPTITGFGAFRRVDNHTVSSKSCPKEEEEVEEEEKLKKMHKETFCAIDFKILKNIQIAKPPPRTRSL